MRLVYETYGIDVALEENTVRVITVEEPTAFSRMMHDLWTQVEGGEGGFILSERDKELKISQKAGIIWNPFAINCNDRKIITKLYQELKECAYEQLTEKTAAVNAAVIEYLDNIIGLVPYHLTFDVEPDLLSLFKVYGVAIDSAPERLLDGIVDYLRVLRQICRVEVLFFVGIKNYLSADEMQMLYEAAFYEKITLVLFEGTDKEKLFNEKHLIIDRDLCTINID